MENLQGRGHLEDLSVDGQIILKCILKYKVWTGFSCVRIGSSGGFLSKLVTISKME